MVGFSEGSFALLTVRLPRVELLTTLFVSCCDEVGVNGIALVSGDTPCQNTRERLGYNWNCSQKSFDGKLVMTETGTGGNCFPVLPANEDMCNRATTLSKAEYQRVMDAGLQPKRCR